MDKRKLVTIVKIDQLLNIENADRIELAIIKGWQCIVQKGIFSINDIAVFHEIDSFVDTSKPAYKWLAKDAKTWKGKTGYRIRTMKLKKTLSQGLLLPMSDFPELSKKLFNIGEDVTELLGVLKWELPEPNQLNVRSPGVQQARFPWFIPKTDEERVQNLPDVLTTQKDKWFEITEKLDGTSATYFYGGPNKEFGVCSRNIWMKNRNRWFFQRWWLKIIKLFKPQLEETRINSYLQIANKYKLDEILPKLNAEYAFQGEIVGAGIQKNHYKLNTQEFYIFNIYDIKNFRYLNPDERIKLLALYWKDAILNKIYLKHVPVIDKFVLTDKFKSIQDIIDYADGQSSVNPKVAREGVVFKRSDGEFSFKSISNKYLLKEE